jgi:hypothetical protein
MENDAKTPAPAAETKSIWTRAKTHVEEILSFTIVAVAALHLLFLLGIVIWIEAKHLFPPTQKEPELQGFLLPDFDARLARLKLVAADGTATPLPLDERGFFQWQPQIAHSFQVKVEMPPDGNARLLVRRRSGTWKYIQVLPASEPIH